MAGGGERIYDGQAASPSYLVPHTTDTALEVTSLQKRDSSRHARSSRDLNAWNFVHAKKTHHDVGICGAISFHEPVELQELVVALQTVRDVGLLSLDVAPAIVAKADEGTDRVYCTQRVGGK